MVFRLRSREWIRGRQDETGPESSEEAGATIRMGADWELSVGGGRGRPERSLGLRGNGLIGTGMWLAVAGCEGYQRRSEGHTLAPGLDSWGRRSGVHSEHEPSMRASSTVGSPMRRSEGMRVGTLRSPLS